MEIISTTINGERYDIEVEGDEITRIYWLQSPEDGIWINITDLIVSLDKWSEFSEIVEEEQRKRSVQGRWQYNENF